MKNNVVYTIGHSSHPIEYFLQLLNTFSIDMIMDVRSVPASSYNPQYNKEPLKHQLEKNRIAYLHAGAEFGARLTDPELLDKEGRVDFELVRKTDFFKRGMLLLMDNVRQGLSIALMCSEADPMECHRFSMISVAVQDAGFEVQHILKDQRLKSNTQLENQLLKKYAKKIPHPDLFQPDITIEDQLAAAYRFHNHEVAYSPQKKMTDEE